MIIEYENPIIATMKNSILEKIIFYYMRVLAKYHLIFALKFETCYDPFI
jgi:hypothetical protein